MKLSIGLECNDMSNTPLTDAVLRTCVDYPDGSEDIGFKRALVSHAKDLERQANELLECLVAALPVMENRAPDFDVVNTAMRNAIAKATGQS